MGYIFSFLRILAFCGLGEVLHFILPLPIPASIYGLVLLLMALKSGIVKPEQVKKVGNFLTGIFPLLFIPGTVGVIELWEILSRLWPVILLVLFVVTALTMAVSGRVTQKLAKETRHE